MGTRKLAVAIAGAVIVALSILATPLPAGADYVNEAQSIDDIRRAVDYRPTSDGDTLRLYRAFLNREPDVGGAIYWISQSRMGANLDDLAWGFAQSIEFIATYGPLSNADFLVVIYSNMLSRSPDQGGFDYWLDQMNRGLSQHGVVRWIVANAEFINRYPFDALPPLNPGDSKNCSDFATQAAAQAWFNHFYPQFGDIAMLDQDADLIACELLA